MYRDFFRLRDEPFRLTPDPRFLHLSEPHQNALRVLLEGIIYRKGLLMITGLVGTGKTTLIHAALEVLADASKQKMPIKSALLFNPTLTREEFFEGLIDEFEVACSSTSKPGRLSALHGMLLNMQKRGGTSVLFIDEAHLLPFELLEEIRLLGNVDSHQEKLLQIVLCGQPELVGILSRKEAWALQQRIAGRAQLRSLAQPETRAYIAERLHAAGLEGPSPFAGQSVEFIQRFSQGVPRLINLVCDGCLMLGFRTQRRTIQPDMVEEVALSLGLSHPTLFLERESPPVPIPSVGQAQKSAVDVLIEGMRVSRAAARE
ncbi:MAG: AAA family ATPase [Candidatus Acidiferrales bacterium]|jgi:general secretion pathway protein A